MVWKIRHSTSLPRMNRSELESKHLAELHSLAAKAGIERYRMLPRDELIDALAGAGETGGGGGGAPARGREQRRRREAGGSGRERRGAGQRERRPRREGQGRRSPDGRSSGERETVGREAPPPAAGGEAAEKPKRRRRRRFGRRGRKTVGVRDLLLPAAPGRQALVYAESRAACTELLRELAAELSGGRGPDPVALLVDPSPEELAAWKREAPKAEIVSAGQQRHAEDAIAQAARRAGSGESVVLLIDSLSRVAAEFGGSKLARELFDAGAEASGAGGGSLTVIAAVERAE
jgi:transcription termination factor Rho